MEISDCVLLDEVTLHWKFLTIDITVIKDDCNTTALIDGLKLTPCIIIHW